MPTEPPAPAVRNTLYESPLVYDVLHAPGTKAEVDGLESIEKRYSRAPRPLAWLEPACGTARHLRLAARRGRSVVGLDLSPAMIAFADSRARADRTRRRSRYLVADMASFAGLIEPHSVAFAFNLINSIRHLDSDRALVGHFNDVARVLHPRGVYAVGLSASAYGLEIPTEDVWSGSRRPLRVSQVIQYEPPSGGPRGSRVERVISHITVSQTGSADLHFDTTYGLRAYSVEQWYKAIERSGLTLVATCDERGAALPPAEPGYTIYVLGVKK